MAELLTFLPIFEDRGYVPSKVVSKGGQLPFYSWEERLSVFVERLYDFDLIVKDFNWSEWQPEAEVYFRQPERLSVAPAEDNWRLLTLHARKDRFVDGHLSSMGQNGHIVACSCRLGVLFAPG